MRSHQTSNILSRRINPADRATSVLFSDAAGAVLLRMMATVAHQLAIAPEQMLSTIAQFANSSAATIPFTLSISAKERRYKKGDIVLMTAAGAGLTGGAAVFRW